MPYVPTDDLSHLEGVRAQSLASYRNLLGDRDGRLANLRELKGPASDTWKRVETKLRNAEEQSRAISARLQRPTDAIRIGTGWAWLGMIAFALLEMPFNKFMLDNILRGNNLGSYVASFAVTLMMIALAHHIGHQARQIHGAYHEKFYLSNILIVIIGVSFLIVCVAILTIGRAFYSSGLAIPVGRDIFSEVGRQIAAAGIWKALAEALSDKAALFVACFNMLGIVVAFVAAFIRIDSDKTYHSALTIESAADRKLSKLQGRYERACEKIGSKFRPLLANMAAAYAAQNAQVVALKRAHNIPLANDDNLDLSSFDTWLTAAREELLRRHQTPRMNDSTRINVDEPSVSTEGETNVSLISTRR